MFNNPENEKYNDNYANRYLTSGDTDFDRFLDDNYGRTKSYNDCAVDGYCSVDPIIYSLIRHINKKEFQHVRHAGTLFLLFSRQR